MIVVSNTSALIGLSNIRHLDILQKLFEEIIPPAVAEEFGEKLPNWVIVRPVSDEKFVKVLSYSLGKGEAEAIALALELNADIIILDDLKAKKFAEDLGLNIIGTAGVILLAKKRGIIKRAFPVLKELREKRFWISDAIIRRIMKSDGEEVE
ncbi:DUF3368 domain-containing protein [Pyrococcus kukulkanii]|uniref:Nucleotide-binding protein n=1 Tax=Pyrococcus kukulkanii TaxID=1609559 RepID=A0A127B9K0_9EURY|nr:DUF3368 domain-containing protein [Pyrococcus kukulkanii]AMM53449.1 hypothetical protein TQ32_02295 [Pyrococcus kukulkanii]